jgi:3-hydroxyisobutyrate dehydrogenase-like beta-hydroxyacid dehydrogenase
VSPTLATWGCSIAKNLIKAGNDIFVWDINMDTRKPLKRKASAAESHDTVKKCQLVVLSVPGLPEIDDMQKGRNSVLAKPRRLPSIYTIPTFCIALFIDVGLRCVKKT